MKLHKALNRMREMHEAYNHASTEDSKRLAAWRDEVIALRDERDRLRKALRPFAEVGDALDTREFINLYERWGTSGKRHVISMQHLKHAAAVYGATK